jgi:predicted O-methyltransferase YrrM
MITPCLPLSADIDLRSAEQLQLLDSFSRIDVSDLMHQMDNNALRYKKNNGRFNLSDAIVLHCMMRTVQPKRIIEIGCGMSSCMMLDTNEQYFNHSIDCTFIDIDLSAFHTFCRAGDIAGNTVTESPIQDIDIATFTALREGDILFIDSSHIYQPGSDVFDIIHRILPVLRHGVYIHVHDMFHDFQYPVEWNNTEWNEQETIFHILQSKPQYHMQFFTSYMAHNYPDIFRQTFPSLVHTAGGSLWLKKNML